MAEETSRPFAWGALPHCCQHGVLGRADDLLHAADADLKSGLVFHAVPSRVPPPEANG